MYGSFRLSADETDGRLLEGLRFYAHDVQREAPCVLPLPSAIILSNSFRCVQICLGFWRCGFVAIHG